MADRRVDAEVLDRESSARMCLTLLSDMKGDAVHLADLAGRAPGCGAMGEAQEEVLAMQVALAAGRVVSAAHELQRTLHRVGEAWLFGDIARLVRHREAAVERLRAASAAPGVPGGGAPGEVAGALLQREVHAAETRARSSDDNDDNVTAGDALNPRTVLAATRKRTRTDMEGQAGDGAEAAATWAAPLHTADAEVAVLLDNIADVVDGGGGAAATRVARSLQSLRTCIEAVCGALPNPAVPFRANGLRAAEVVSAAAKMRLEALQEAV